MISRILLLIGITCLGLFCFSIVQAEFQQQALEEELYQELYHARETDIDAKPTDQTPKHSAHVRHLQDGDLFGKLEVPRLNMSVMVMEGDSASVLRLGAG